MVSWPCPRERLDQDTLFLRFVEEAERNLAGWSKRSFSEAAGEANTAGVPVSPAHPKRTKMRSFPAGYIEDVGETRTKFGKERVLTRLGQGGCNRAFFIILPGSRLRDEMQTGPWREAVSGEILLDGHPTTVGRLKLGNGEQPSACSNVYRVFRDGHRRPWFCR
jgi:hypothetical protein